MKKTLIFIFIATLFCSLVCNKIEAKTNSSNNIKISNKYFSVYLNNNVKGKYIVKKQKNGIFIYDKSSLKAGFNGLAFGVKMYKNPSEHANMPGGRKIGELTDKKGIIYDMVLIQPTEVQYDYINGKPESYDILYRSGETINKTIVGTKKTRYYNDRGMKGEELYKQVLQKHLRAIKEKWDSIKLEQENMSCMYNVLSQEKDNPADKIGYAYYDTNGDGIDELFIGEIAQGNCKGVINDIYNMVDRKPAHVVSGGSRNRYYVCDKAFICNEYSSGASERGWNIYVLLDNSTELYPQVGFKYDEYTNKQNPWFISYNFTENVWENVSEKTIKERKAVFEKYERFDYIPFSSLNDKEYNN